VSALQLSETTMSQKCGPREEPQKITMSFFSAFSANFLARKLCGFFSVKTKLFRLGSAFHWLLESHSSGVKLPKMFPAVSSMNVRVFARPSQRP
jgi:hypothetical protein